MDRNITVTFESADEPTRADYLKLLETTLRKLDHNAIFAHLDGEPFVQLMMKHGDSSTTVTFR